MSTPKQIAANRRNAQKSTGPRTAEGKAKTRLNPLKHGLTAETIVLPFESPDDYRELQQSVLDDLQPQGVIHQILVKSRVGGYPAMARCSPSALAGVAFPMYPQGRHPRFTFSKLNTLPADASCLRFDDSLTTATARLKVRWFATPFLQDSFIPYCPYCMPVYPGPRIPGDGPVRSLLMPVPIRGTISR